MAERRGFAILRALKADEGAEHGRQRKRGAAGQDQREEELRPAGDEGEDSGRDDARCCKRHGDAPERLPARAAVDQGRFLHRFRHAAEIGEHHPHRHRQREDRIGDDQAECVS